MTADRDDDLKLKLGLVQMATTPGDRVGNVAKAVRYIDSLAERGADLVVIPEFFNTEYFYQYRDTKYLDTAETETGPSLQTIRERARAHKIHIVATLLEMHNPGVYYDTAFFIGPDGETVGKYRKTHPGGSMSLEKLYFRGGNNFPNFDVKGFRVGAMICYDHFFPETARCLALNGAEVIVGPFCAPAEACPWENVMRTRAFENGAYLAPTNKVGKDGDFTLGGQSMVVNPRGEILERLDNKEEGTILVGISKREVNLARRRFPMLRDRRPEIYQPLGATL